LTGPRVRPLTFVGVDRDTEELGADVGFRFGCRGGLILRPCVAAAEVSR
jgi:hypothetical protein